MGERKMTMIREQPVRARKDHPCAGCADTIRRRLRYYRTVYVDEEGQFQSVALCVACHVC